MRSLVLLTESYPYKHSGERPFLDPELRCLMAEFDRVIIVPGRVQAGGIMIFSGVRVEEGLAKTLSQRPARSGILINAVTSRLFYQELFKKPLLLFDPAALKRLVLYIDHARRIERWIRRFIAEQKIEPQNTLFYSYWCNETATALSLIQRRYPRLKLVSRAHGYDLYEQRYQPAYIPCRAATFSSLRRLFLISDNGRKHIVDRFPWLAGSCQVSRLGVADPGFIAQRSTDGVFRVVSCSNIIPLKRLPLLIRALKELAEQRPQQKLEWHHFGDGPEQEAVQQLAATVLPENVRAVFHGRVPNHKLIKFYRTDPVDVFINISNSEGLPVSIMEALSCGIPVIAPDIGGISEIVTSANGQLLKTDPGPGEIAQALIDLIDDPQLEKKKTAGRRTWEAKLDSKVNHQTFSRALSELCGNKT